MGLEQRHFSHFWIKLRFVNAPARGRLGKGDWWRHDTLLDNLENYKYGLDTGTYYPARGIDTKRARDRFHLLLKRDTERAVRLEKE